MVKEILLPPHLKVAETVTDQEYAKAKWQSQVILLVALAAGVVVAAILMFLWSGMKGLVVGGLAGVGSERLMDQILTEGKKMRTQRMKVYPQLRDYLKRQGGA